MCLDIGSFLPKFLIFLFMCEMVCCYQTCYKRSCVRGRSYAHNRTLSFKVLLSYADKRYVMGNIASRPCHFMFKAIFCFKKLTFGNFSCAWIVGCTLPCRLFCNGIFLQNPYQTGPKVNENELLKHAGASQKDSSYLLSMTFFWLTVKQGCAHTDILKAYTLWWYPLFGLYQV